MMIVLKSGWVYLHCDHKLLKKWKLRYLVLYEDAKLSIYGKPRSLAKRPKYQLDMKKDCKRVLVGASCYRWKSMQFPKGVLDLNALFSMEIDHRQRKDEMVWAAFSREDCKEWTRAIKYAVVKVTCCDIFEKTFNVKRNHDSK